MTDEQADTLTSLLRDLLAEVRALRADLAPKPSAPINTAPWMPLWPSTAPQFQGYQCAGCGQMVYGNYHTCPGTIRYSTAGTNES
jgi:hypothetical protein